MGHKVLLADDSITVQKIVKLSLTEEGIEVIALGNGEQAVQQLEAIQPDLVMADVFMPGKDGYEVCEFVKSHPQFKHTPVILLVHAFEPFDPDRAKKVCADQQLTKPFQSIRTLVSTVQDLLATPQSSRIAAEAPVTAEIANTEVAPEPTMLSTASLPVSAQPQEEFAVVSSFSATASTTGESESASGGTRMPELTLVPPLSSFDSPQQVSLSEISLPVPGADVAMEMPKTDFLPPLELSVLPQTDWQSTPIPMAEAAHEVFDASALSAISLASTPVGTGDVAEDVLDLSDVLSSNSGNLPTSPGLSASFSPVNDTPLLATLSPVTTEPESVPDAIAPTPPPVPDSVSLVDTFDMGVGQINLDAPLPLEEPASPIEVAEVNPAPVLVPGVDATMPISEAMIEEIANRVIQRLSAQAIQEIAWEVVPEMAELLIRKQISQHPQLSH